jgi:ribosome-binding factor A
MNESNRQKKFGRLIQKEISEILQREVKVQGEPMLTVTVVRGTPDLKSARIYISVFPDGKGQAAVDELNERIWEVRNALGRRVRQQLRFVPEVQFFLDDTLQEVAYMDRLFSKIGPIAGEEE